MRRSPANVSTVRTLPRVAEHSVGTAALVTGLRCRTGDVACTVDLAPDLARQLNFHRMSAIGPPTWPLRNHRKSAAHPEVPTSVAHALASETE